MSRKTEADSDDRTIIGKIVGAHGVNGTMLILPLTDYPERFLKMKEIVLNKPGKPRQVLTVRKLVPYEGKGTFFLNAEGIKDRETAESFKGSIITVPDKERIELPEDEYWIDDIIGLKVIENTTGCELGTVEEVILTGSNDVYLIKTPEGAVKPVPAIADVINKVDIAAGILRVTIPEGLWD
jgi:16S rRNA processing protein RimM